MLAGTSKVYILDKTGKVSFNTLCSTQYASSEVKNLELKLKQARQYPEAFKFLDIESARVVQEDAEALPEMTDDELLEALAS